MLEAAVWGDDEALAGDIAAASAGRALVRAARQAGRLAGEPLDLLVIAPGADAPAEGAELRCRAALVPGDRACLCRWVRAGSLVSYGMGQADTLTLSGVWEGRAALCVQREFPALDGGTVERQELVLPYRGPAPEGFLARAGALLLLGLPLARGEDSW